MQVLLAFGIARGLIVLTKTKNESRMKEILAAQTLALDSTDMTKLRGLERNLRYVSGQFMLRAEESTDDLWDTDKDRAFQLGN